MPGFSIKKICPDFFRGISLLIRLVVERLHYLYIRGLRKGIAYVREI
jgi:hypothetical protein